MQRKSCVLGVSALLLLLVACGSWTKSAAAADNKPRADVAVSIDNFKFSPDVITVAPGTTVHWTNRDDIPHTVVSDDKTTFKSKVMDTDEQFSYTFTKAGTYSYFCSIHPHMTGKVVVQ